MTVYVIIWSWWDDWEVIDVATTHVKAVERIMEVDSTAKGKMDDANYFASDAGHYRIYEKQLI